MIFKRKIYEQLLNWKNESRGHSALLVSGARRIGKSTIVEEFARNEYDSHIIIDFARPTDDVRRLFASERSLDRIFLELQALYKTELHERRSLIVFDEVQLFPKARQAIKYLVADGRYDYIETGSLLSIRKNIEGIVLPSEERRIDMRPMDFEEFLWAIGDTATMKLARQAFNDMQPLGDAVHRRIMRDFRLYMLVGGMPQAIVGYLESNSLSKVDEVKKSIIELYAGDFVRIDNTGRMSLLFRSVPSQLSFHSSRYMVSQVLENRRVSQTLGPIADLCDSMTVNPAYRISDPHVGLPASMDLEWFKLYMADTGLFVTASFWDKDFTENTIYAKLLSDKLDANLGYLYENVVAQELTAAGHRLYFTTFPHESSNHCYEIDFLLSKGSKIWPLEVKSSAYKRHASLDAFAKKYSGCAGRKVLIYTKDLRKEEDILCLPCYMAGLL